MKIRFTLALLMLFLTNVSPALEISYELKPYTAEYEARYNGRKLKGERSLTVKDGIWAIESSFKNLLVSIQERSSGTVIDNKLVPAQFDYKRKILGTKKRQQRLYDWDNKQIRYTDGDKSGHYDLPAETFDSASQQLFIREMLERGETRFSMPIAARNRLKHNDYEVAGIETLNLPVGTISAVRVNSTKQDSDKRQTVMWFDANNNYHLVKLAQTEKDGKTYHMELKSLTQ